MAQQVTVDQSRRDAVDTKVIRQGLRRRLAELREESDQAAAVVSELRSDVRDEPVGDEADLVAKVADLDREASIITGIKDRIGDVQHALERLDAGRYGWCEECGDSIPGERLVVFPAATLCVSCKSAQEKR
ncbi:MAG TPA: TraR/DksA family transcriptional regulator [Micromonosporaceae bacterium]|jgi:DnaK suppressor protein|nr:TraR/DksA family transcriptional regulator [Micromonosporaceae bacterium]